jgi:phosphatidylserine/phosphatidylglycerophosphate/cardiolipin synthase-like enzyme
LVGLLLATFDAEPGDIWLISPWLRDVELPVARLGHFSSVFGGHRDLVTLADVLARMAQRHRLRVVTKPPAELVPLSDLRRLMELWEATARIRADKELQGYAAVDDAVRTLNAEAAAIEDGATQHFETLRIAFALQRQGADLLFLPRLHAKLLWTPSGALLGSANFTGGGFGGNEELMVEVTTSKEHGELGTAAATLSSRAVSVERYSITAALQRVGIGVPELRTLGEHARSGDRTRLRDLLRWLVALAR